MRISRHCMWMNIAEVFSCRSTCCRANNGAIIVSRNNIIGHGYNGPPSGEPHCTGNDCVPLPFKGCVRAIHAERNAITRCVANPSGADLYCTMSPCFECAELIIESKIKRVFYRYPYRESHTVEWLDK